ncbi:MAG: hypothetical protein K0B10_01290 [Vicingaceae bacterium]|nr:hypothetical protein [Vicingaceae bacterium]
MKKKIINGLGKYCTAGTKEKPLVCPLNGQRQQNNYQHTPMQYIEGDPKSAIWIVGLNPKFNNNNNDLHFRNSQSLKNPLTPNTHPYFKPFLRVSGELWKKDINGILSANFAHTDLVCCATEKFPPPPSLLTKPEAELVIENCKPYLIAKLKQNIPKLIIGAGKRTCIELVKTFMSEKDKTGILLQNKNITNSHIEKYHIEKYIEGMTQTTLLIDEKFEVPIIFSVHLSQSNYWSDRRLGREIEQVLGEINYQNLP